MKRLFGAANDAIPTSQLDEVANGSHLSLNPGPSGSGAASGGAVPNGGGVPDPVGSGVGPGGGSPHGGGGPTGGGGGPTGGGGGGSGGGGGGTPGSGADDSGIPGRDPHGPSLAPSGLSKEKDALVRKALQGRDGLSHDELLKHLTPEELQMAVNFYREQAKIAKTPVQKLYNAERANWLERGGRAPGSLDDWKRRSGFEGID